MKKNLAVDVPRDAETEVDRIRGLKKSIFTRTRIACLCLVMVLALSVSSTLAFEKYSGNATPNRGTMSYVGVVIGEDTTGSYDWTGNDKTDVQGGDSGKKVKVKLTGNGEEENRVEMTFIPLAQSINFTDQTNNPKTDAYYNEASGTGEVAYSSFDQWWSAPKSELVGGSIRWYIETGVMKLYLASDWETYWTNSNGVFISKNTYKAGQETPVLLTGMDLQESVSKDVDYAAYKVRVVARVTQEPQVEETPSS